MERLKELHDTLLSMMPTGASHNAEGCPLCPTALTEENASHANQIDQTTETPEGGAMSDKTYTEDDVQAAVAKATADLASELAELKTSLATKDQETEIASAVEAAVASKDGEIAELNNKLDVAVLEAENAKKELTELTSLIEEEKARQEREAEIAARRDERLAKVAAVASFTEEYVAARAERWVAMSDEDFAALIADLEATSTKEVASQEEPTLGDIPRETAMQGERTTKRTPTRLDATKAIFSDTLAGVDFRSL